MGIARETTTVGALASTVSGSQRPQGRSMAVALLFVAPVLASGYLAALPLPLVGWAAAFLFLALAHDLRSQRIPNWITLPAFVAALGYGAWAGGTAGALHALLGAGAALALLVLPYGLGAIGAGDVKAAMALGAGFGATAVAELSLVALGLGAGFAALRIALHGSAPTTATLWSGVPFAMAIALALTAQQLMALV